MRQQRLSACTAMPKAMSEWHFLQRCHKRMHDVFCGSKEGTVLISLAFTHVRSARPVLVPLVQIALLAQPATSLRQCL